MKTQHDKDKKLVKEFLELMADKDRLNAVKEFLHQEKQEEKKTVNVNIKM